MQLKEVLKQISPQLPELPDENYFQNSEAVKMVSRAILSSQAFKASIADYLIRAAKNFIDPLLYPEEIYSRENTDTNPLNGFQEPEKAERAAYPLSFSAITFSAPISRQYPHDIITNFYLNFSGCRGITKVLCVMSGA